MTRTVLQNAWGKYHTSANEARIALENTQRFKDNPQDRAQAYYSLTEAQAMAYNYAIAPSMCHPMIHTRSWFSYFYTLGGHSPDFYYGTLFLDGGQTYRVTGRMGDLKLLLMQVFSHLLGHPNSKLLGNYDFSTFTMNADGAFEVIISATQHEGNWIPLDPESDYNFIFMRRAMSDWYGDRGEIQLELVGEMPHDADTDEVAIARRVDRAADFLSYLVVKWNIGIYDLWLKTAGGSRNNLVVVPGEAIASDFAGSPTTYYTWGVGSIKPDEAFIAEFDASSLDAGYWSFQIFDVWCKPLDFLNHQSDVNMSRATIDSDGKLRVVVSHRDPGVANWVDPIGRLEFMPLLRSYHAKSPPAKPDVRIVKLSDLQKSLPPDTRMVSPSERKSALEYRRIGYLKMFGE